MQNDLERSLGRLEGKLDAVLSEMRGRLRSAETRLDDIEGWRKRIDARESERSGAVKAARWLYGALTALIGLIGGALGGRFIH